MKRICLLFLLLGCTFMSVAQSIRYPFVEEGKVWLIEEAFQADFENPEYSDTLRYTLQGDTLIAGKTAKKMFREAWGGFSFKKYKRASPAYTYGLNGQMYS